MRAKLLWVAAVLAVAQVAQAADPQPYVVKIYPTGNRALNAALRASSQLDSLRTSAPVGPFPLIDRAQQDLPRLQTALDSFGYYRASLSVSINGHPLDDPDLPNILTALPKGQTAKVDVHVTTGALFHLRKLTVDGTINPQAMKAFALASGAPAVASQVLAARDRLLNALQEQGHAFATVSEPIAYEDAQLPVLDVTFMVDAGPSYELGEIRLEGLKRVHEGFLRQQLLLRPGQPYSPGRIEQARTTLLGLGVFASVTVRLPPRAQVQGQRLPVVFVVVERARHAVSLNAAYSSDLGASAGATWTDRNLFGNAEQLVVNASIINLGGTASNGLGYDTGAQLTKPDFLQINQSLQFSLVALSQHLVAYDQVEATAGTSLNRKISSHWNVSLGVTVEQEKITQPGVGTNCRSVDITVSPEGCHYTVLSLPLSARYDSTDLASPLDDPRQGLRASLSIAPTASALSAVRSSFEIVQASASSYFDLAALGWNEPGRSVIALRALAAEARGAAQFSLPPDLRFYAGGSATVRGYAYQSVGPTFPTTDPANAIPEGGTGLLAGSVEFRQRLGSNFGMALFVDAGKVTGGSPQCPSTSIIPTCETTTPGAFSFGYGAGPRYYTPIGPIRFDVALPFKKLPGGQALEVYIGLGQAF